MSQPRHCPRCGATLPAEALQGLCPACLLRQGATADTGSQGEGVPVDPLAVEEVARLFPQLEVLALLGQGGMGSVYKARQPALDRYVALKILPQRAGGHATFGDRFQREARALARLGHPNIVAVYDFGQTEGVPWLLMEYVDGVNLRQLQRNRRLAPREALQLVPQICDALQYAHDEGIVHRDIKPENVLVDRKGRVKIADFGLARMLGAEGVDLRLTGEGQIMGTPHYMAPEQVEHPLEVDHRADIYALGVVFYELLTGELPLGKFPPPSRRVQVDVRLDEVVLRALEKEPARRYQQASEVKSDVETIAGSPEGVAAVGPGSGASRSTGEGGAGMNSTVASPRSAPDRRRQARLWYGLIVSAIGIPAGLALDLPLVWALGLVGFLVAAYKLGWWRWRRADPWRRAISRLGFPSSAAPGSRPSKAASEGSMPLALWPALATLGIAGVAKLMIGPPGIPTAIGDVLLLLGLLVRWRVAWVTTLFFAVFGTVWTLIAASSGLALGVLLVNGLVAASVWLSASWFFPGPPERLARRRNEALLGLVFLLLPGLFLAALLGDVIGLDIDAQFYAALIGLPLVTGLAGLLVRGLIRFSGEDHQSGKEPRPWSWRAVVGGVVLGLNLPFFGTSLLIVRAIAEDPSWNPAPAEAWFTFGIVGGSLLLTLTCILLGIIARRECGAEAPSRRGGRLAWACIWLWPVLLVSAFSVHTERVDPSAAVKRENLATTGTRLAHEIVARASLLGVRWRSPLDSPAQSSRPEAPGAP